MNPSLVIDYVLEGENRGYNFITPTDHLAPATVRTIWRQAMPRGQGWNAARYLAAHSLKCIPLENGRVAFSDVVVTAMQDEVGRQGIRRAEVQIAPAADYQSLMQARYAALPLAVRTAAEDKIGLGLWKRVFDKTLPKLKGDSQIILAHPYTNAEAWQVVEAVVLRLAMARLVKGWGKFTPFTTLALDYREESRLVAVPQEIAASFKPNKSSAVINIG